MIALDTNVVLRFLVQDDPLQSARAVAFFASLSPEQPAYLCREVLVELVQVLERDDRLSRPEIAAALDGLLSARELIVEAREMVGQAVQRYRQGGASFSDQMIVVGARLAGCHSVVSFDRQAGMTPHTGTMRNP